MYFSHKFDKKLSVNQVRILYIYLYSQLNLFQVWWHFLNHWSRILVSFNATFLQCEVFKKPDVYPVYET